MRCRGEDLRKSGFNKRYIRRTRHIELHIGPCNRNFPPSYFLFWNGFCFHVTVTAFPWNKWSIKCLSKCKIRGSKAGVVVK